MENHTDSSAVDRSLTDGVGFLLARASGLLARAGNSALAPFGLSWYQGDLTTDANGKGIADFIGRFSIETFIVGPGSGPAPVVHPQDAAVNPATAPIHTYHVGLWFGSATAAANPAAA